MGGFGVLGDLRDAIAVARIAVLWSVIGSMV